MQLEALKLKLPKQRWNKSPKQVFQAPHRQPLHTASDNDSQKGQISTQLKKNNKYINI